MAWWEFGALKCWGVAAGVARSGNRQCWARGHQGATREGKDIRSHGTLRTLVQVCDWG